MPDNPAEPDTEEGMIMKKLSILGIGALVALAACADNPLAPETALDKKVGTMNAAVTQVNGPVWVEMAFTAFVGGNGGFAPGENAHPQGKGHCATEASSTPSGTQSENTVWYNEQGNKTNSKFCEGSTGAGVEVTCVVTGDDAIPATYAAAANTPGAGNENLNFLTDEEGEVEDLFVHYKSNRDWTDARGELEFSYVCNGGAIEGEGVLDLTQFATDNPDGGNMFEAGPPGDRQLDVTGVEVSTDDGDFELTSLYWTFRSRVGQ
jgi:hypothetical protein